MRVAPLLGALALLGCASAGRPRAPAPLATPPASFSSDVRVAGQRPPVAAIVRDGDPRGAIAVAVSTDGIESGRGAAIAVALSGLTLARLQARGIADATATAGWDGYRVRVLVGDVAQAATVVLAIRAAMTTPLSTDPTELAAARRRVDALLHRPMADTALYDATRCTGEPFSVPGDEEAPPDAAQVESWRLRAHVQSRVALAAVGKPRLADVVADVVSRDAPWPLPSPVEEQEPVVAPAESLRGMPEADGRSPVLVYEASDLPPGSARATLAFHTARPEQGVAVADTLGDPRGALATRLGALESSPRLVDVTATARPGEGCLALTLLFPARDAEGGGPTGAPERAPCPNDSASRIATAVALARQEATTELAEVLPDGAMGHRLADRAGDPRDAAERAAWWTLVALRGAARSGPARAHAGDVSIAIGLGTGRDISARPDATRRVRTTPTPAAEPTVPTRAEAIRAELDRAIVAWHEPVVQARSRVEAAQGEMWLLLASPCGTIAETDGDAGLGAVVALATASLAPLAVRASSVTAEGWVANDGIGVIVHGPALPGESPAAHARRLADAAARSFAADSLDTDAVARARGSLLGRAGNADASRAYAVLASVLAPGHPSWIAPLGTAEALGRSSDAAVTARAAALRAGPLRVAVIANADAGQSEAAVHAVDRWVARRPGESRSCPQATAVSGVRPGTYPVEIAGAPSSEAWLAFALPPNDATARLSATLLAAVLDGPTGLLGRSLGAGFARGWSARVVGPTPAPALVVRVWSAQGALDGAVAETRALFERLRQGALVETDRTRALAELDAAALARQLDPKNRLIALWRGESGAETRGADRGVDPRETPPSLETMRAFAAATLRDEALIVVAARPPRELHGAPRAGEGRP
jgi:hypothetical protein